ncbi:restriction endonuclease subunit R, partial [Pseudomonas qingdaonensis]
MTTGVDAQTCKLIVLDQHIKSMTEFKQIIGRGTRINEDFGKYWFTIMDFKKATELFADPAFDGDPVVVYAPEGSESPIPPDDLLEGDGISAGSDGEDDDLDFAGEEDGKRRIKYVI